MGVGWGNREIGERRGAGYPHHVTQGRNRPQKTFFAAADYGAYVGLMAEWCGPYGASGGHLGRGVEAQRQGRNSPRI